MSQEMSFFSTNDSLGSMGVDEISEYLLGIGDIAGARVFTSGSVSPQGLFGPKTAYSHTGFILAYIPPADASSTKTCSVVGIGEVEGDKTLVGNRIKISLDKFFVSAYPGSGDHLILCEFAGKNQVAGETEELRFALQFKAADKASASVSGAPIFLGVTVGSDGISFEGRSVNVSSSTDDGIVAALDDQAFKNGLSLLLTAQPALKPLSTLAAAAVKAIAGRSKNKQVHNFKLGLDFSSGSSSARLRHGSYIVVQSDATQGWDWSAFEWNRHAMALQYKATPSTAMEFNYMVFGVAPFTGSK